MVECSRSGIPTRWAAVAWKSTPGSSILTVIVLPFLRLTAHGGVITDDSPISSGTIGTPTLTIEGSHSANGNGDPPLTASIYGGQIEDGPSQVVSLELYGELTLTGQNHFTGGVLVHDGWLQVGDGTTNGSIEGLVLVVPQDGLIFDVAANTQETFDGIIYYNEISSNGSFLKTGGGTLSLTYDPYYANTKMVGGDNHTPPVNGNNYPGSTRVEYGTLRLGDSNALPTTTNLIIDNEATVDLGGNTVTVQSVTLNNGAIASTDGKVNSPLSLSGVLVASDSFNLDNGVVNASVTLTGTASLNNATGRHRHDQRNGHLLRRDLR